MSLPNAWKKLCSWTADTADKRHSTATEDSNEKIKDDIGVGSVESQTADYDAAAFSKIRAIECMRTWKGRYFLYAGYVYTTP